MSSRRREDRSTTADAYRTWQSSGKYQTDYETERRRHRSSTLPANPQESRHYPTQDPRYHDSRQSSRPHRKDQTHYYPPASYPPPAAGPSTGRTSTHHVARQHSTSGGYPYHQSSSYHTSAPSQPPPASRGTVGAPMPSSSRRPYQEALDPRVHPQTVSTTAPAVQASYDKGSGAAEAARSAKQRTTHSSTQPALAQPSHVVWVPPQQEMGSTRRHKGGDGDNERGRDRDREHERGKTRETERTPAEVEKERHISRSERHRERDRPSEPERYKDYREPSKSRHRRESDSEGIAHADRLNGHRRHRTEDSIAPTSSSRRQLAEDPRVPSTRRHAEAAQNPINSAQAHLTADPQAEGVDSAQRGEQSSNAPPAPRVMPVYLPTKASKPSRSHHDKRLSVAAQAQGAHSGSDTERPSGRHRMERTHSGAAVQRNDGYAPSTTRERGGRDAQPDAREDAKEGKFGSYNARQPRNQVNGIPPVTPPNVQVPPSDARVGPSVAQFVSIRAGQGPSDPQAYDAHFKSPSALRSDDPQGTVRTYATSASIVKPPAHTGAHSYEVPRPHADQFAAPRSRAEPYGVEPFGTPYASGRDANQVAATSLSRTVSQQARGHPETGVENTSSSVHASSYPARPPSRSAQRAPSAHATPPTVGRPGFLRTDSQGPQTTYPPTRPPSVAPYASVAPSASSHPSGPPSPAVRGSSGYANTGHTSSAHPSPKDAHPSIGVSYHDVHGRPPQMQRAPSGPPTAHATPLVAPQIMPSSSHQSRHGQYPSSGGDQQHVSPDNRPTRQSTSQGGARSSYTTQSTPASAKNAVIAREDRYMRDQQSPPGLLEGAHVQLRQVLHDDDAYPTLGSSMMKSVPSSTSQRTPPYGTTRPSASRGASADNSPQVWQRQASTPAHSSRDNLHQHEPSPKFMSPPQIAIVGATPDSKVGDLPHQRVDDALLIPPDPSSARDARTKSSRGQRSKRAPRNDLPSSQQQQQPTSRQAPAQTRTQFQTSAMYHTPPFSSSLAPDVETSQSSPPPLPIPPPRGLEDSPAQAIETRLDEMMPAAAGGDDDDDEWDTKPSPPSWKGGQQPTSASTFNPQSTSRSPWQSNETGYHSTLPHIHVTAPQTDPRSSKPATMPPLQSSVATDNKMGFHQTTARMSTIPQSQPSAVPAKTRPKVTIEHVPDSPSNALTDSAKAVTVGHTSSRPPTAQRETTGNAYTSSSLKPVTVDHSSYRTSPPSKAKDSPSQRVAEPSPTPAALTMPPAPTTHTSSSRVPLSAPPIQQTFSSSQPQPISQQPIQRSVSHAMSSRTPSRSTDPAQFASKPPAAHAAPYPTHPNMTTSQHASALPPATSASHNATSSAHTAATAQAHGTAKHPTSSGTYTAPSAFASKSAAATTHGVQQSTVNQHHTSGTVPPTTTSYNHPVTSAAGGQPSSTSKPTVTVSTSGYAAPSTLHNKIAVPPVNTTQTANGGIPLSSALGLYPTTTVNGASAQPSSSAEAYKHQYSRQAAPQSSTSHPASAAHVSFSAKPQAAENLHVDPSHSRETTSAPRNPSSQAPTAVTRPNTATATFAHTSQQGHNRSVSAPTGQPSTIAQNPPSPRKVSHPTPSTSISTQPFPSKPSPPQPSRVPDSGHVSTPAPSRARITLPPLDRTKSHDSEVLKTPSSIAQSPMPHAAAVPVRQRQISTDSKDSTKKKHAIFSLFRTKPGSTKQYENSTPSPPTRTSTDQQRSHTEPTATTISSQRAAKELKERPSTQQAAATTSPSHANGGPSHSQSKSRSKPSNPVTAPPVKPSARERKESGSNLLTPFKFLTMNSRRNRTISGASLDACDGNTATNTVVESPAQSTVGPAPFPPLSPPPIRDPMLATTEWRDREEAERREQKRGKILRPGVTFDVADDPPPTGTSSKRGAKLVRRKSGRTGTRER